MSPGTNNVNPNATSDTTSITGTAAINRQSATRSIGAQPAKAKGKEAVLFLKKKNQKNFYPFGVRGSLSPSLRGPPAAFQNPSLRALAKQSSTSTCFTAFAANTPSGLKLPSLVPASGKKFFWFFFFKKRTTCLPSTCLPVNVENQANQQSHIRGIRYGA
jgi:hypothetical protein